VSSPKRKPYKNSIDQGDAECPPLSEKELLRLLALIDKADLWLNREENLVAGLMTLAVQTYLDIDALTTVESIADQPSRPPGLLDAIRYVRWELLEHLDDLPSSKTQTAPDAQEEE
jgi:hypothetical protein